MPMSTASGVGATRGSRVSPTEQHECADCQVVLTGGGDVSPDTERRVARARDEHQNKGDGTADVRLFVKVRRWRRSTRRCYARYRKRNKYFFRTQ